MNTGTISAIRTIRRQWSEETGFYSRIEDLSLPGRRRWTRVFLSARGTQWSQIFRLRLQKDGSQTLLDESFALNRGEIWSRSLSVTGPCHIQAQGFIQASGLAPAGALVELTGYYEDEPELLSQSVTLDLETGALSVIQDLFLPAVQVWERAELAAFQREGAPAFVRLGLLANGLLCGYPSDSFQAEGEAEADQPVVLSFPVGAKVPLVGIGCAESLVPLLTSRIQITLKGYYNRKEEI